VTPEEAQIIKRAVEDLTPSPERQLEDLLPALMCELNVYKGQKADETLKLAAQTTANNFVQRRGLADRLQIKLELADSVMNISLIYIEPDLRGF
jgi:hypothetical protein